MRRSRGCQRGTTLIEAMVAIVLIASACAGLVPLLGQTVSSMHDMAARERDLQGAIAALDATARWTTPDFEARTGISRLALNRIRITPVGNGLYDVEILDTLRAVSILQTTIYRPDSASASR